MHRAGHPAWKERAVQSPEHRLHRRSKTGTQVRLPACLLATGKKNGISCSFASKGLFLRVALDTDFIHLTPREMNQNLLEGLQTRIPAGGLHSAASIPTGQLGAFLSGVRGRRQTGGLRPHRSPHRPGWQSPCSKSTSRKSSSFLVALAPLPMLGRPCTGWSPPRPGSQPGVLKQGCLCPHRAPGSIGEFRLSRGGGLDWHLAAGGQGRSSTP